MRRHDRSEEGDDKDHKTGGRTHGYSRYYEEEIIVLVEKNDDLESLHGRPRARRGRQ